MNKKILTIILFLIVQVVAFHSQAAIGDWKAYMAYHDVQEIEQAGNLVFVQASNGLYVYNKNDQSIQTFSKIDYLSDCNISHIAYNKSTKRLVIIYSNGNIDLMNINNYEVTNLSDYYNTFTSENKTVNDIYTYGNYAYLSTGFGIVKLNVSKTEISDTYNLGFKVDWCEINGNKIYAYSQTNGKYTALLSDNLSDKNKWNKEGGYSAKVEEDKSELKQLVSTLNPGGPKYNYFGCMRFTNNQLYTCGGGFSYIEFSRPGCAQVLKNDTWQIYEDNLSTKTGYSYIDTDNLDIDPLDPNHVFVSGRTGIYEFQDGIFLKNYTNDNTNNVLQTASTVGNNNKDYVIVTALKYDKDGNLWGFNSISPSTSLFAYTKDKEWVSHHKSEFMYSENKSLENVNNIIEDSRRLLWFGNNHWDFPYLYCYQPSTDAAKCYKKFTNQDGTEVSVGYVRAIAEDNKNNIWVGTSAGPLMLEVSQITQDSPVFTQVKVPRNDGTNYADYLLSGVDITCIAIDKANRKWFGTSGNGVYLISDDNIQQLQHFTRSNSPLLSDDIESIAINTESGEVYFGTNLGLCSYQSDVNSINEEMNKDNVWAYPNPVKPDYTGVITIIGLSNKADIKIVTSNGVLVNKGTSNGGIYQWDGRDLKGKMVTSGIYMVETATSDGSKGTVCKIAIIR
uniref:type IX secretion system anionic LPS delivery protein PorZ n=1 Tax=Segatella hominis TaxID=2518605 RepID=UPI0040295F1F